MRPSVSADRSRCGANVTVMVLLMVLALLSTTGAAAEGQSDERARRSCATPRPYLRRTVPTDTALPCIARIQMFADGHVKDVVGGGDTPASVAGALGLRYTGSRYDVTGVVNIAAIKDTVVARYGASLLVPGAGPGLNGAVISIRRRFRDWKDRRCGDYIFDGACNWGMALHAGASSHLWATRVVMRPPPTPQGDSVREIAATTEIAVWSLTLGLYHQFFDAVLESDDGTSTPVAMSLDLGLTNRALRGDIASTSAARAALRDSLLSSRRREFPGVEVGLTLQYGQLRSSLSYVWLPGTVDGLTGGQILAGAELRAPLATGLYRRK